MDEVAVRDVEQLLFFLILFSKILTQLRIEIELNILRKLLPIIPIIHHFRHNLHSILIDVLHSLLHNFLKGLYLFIYFFKQSILSVVFNSLHFLLQLLEFLSAFFLSGLFQTLVLLLRHLFGVVLFFQFRKFICNFIFILTGSADLPHQTIEVIFHFPVVCQKPVYFIRLLRLLHKSPFLSNCLELIHLSTLLINLLFRRLLKELCSLCIVLILSVLYHLPLDLFLPYTELQPIIFKLELFRQNLLKRLLFLEIALHCRHIQGKFPLVFFQESLFINPFLHLQNIPSFFEFSWSLETFHIIGSFRLLNVPIKSIETVTPYFLEEFLDSTVPLIEYHRFICRWLLKFEALIIRSIIGDLIDIPRILEIVARWHIPVLHIRSESQFLLCFLLHTCELLGFMLLEVIPIDVRPVNFFHDFLYAPVLLGLLEVPEIKLHLTLYDFQSIMMHQSLALQDQLICVLSDNHYYVNIVTPSQEQLRISSDESITLIQHILIPKSQQSHLFILDCQLNWSIFTVSPQETTIRLQGRLDPPVLPAKIVNVHQVKDKTILLFDDLQLYYFQMPSGNTKQFLPYGQNPEFEHGEYLIQKGYLPSPKTHRIVQSCLTNTTLYLAYQEILSQVSLIYTLKIDLELYSLLSGRICICNISQKVVGLYALGELVIAQTEHQLHILNEKLESFNYSFLQKLVESKGALYGCVAHESNTIVYKITPRDKSILIDKFKHLNLSILQIYPNSTNFQLSFALTPKHEIIRINDPKEKKVTNIHVTISSASLSQTPTHNLLRAEKRVGAKKETILVTNQWLTLNLQAHKHNLPLQMAKLLRGSATSCTLSSVIIGTVQFQIRKGEVSLKQSQSLKECLYCDKSNWITQSEVSINNKSVSIPSLFQNATDTISQACVQDGIIFLCIFDQLHAFDGKLTRKFIHCFNSQIKQVISLNEVNIIGVQLYEGDTHSDSHIQIMRVGEEGLTLIQEITFLQSSDWSPIRFSIQINTASYCLNVLGPKIVICTNDSLHRYQADKIQVMAYNLPLKQAQQFHIVKIEDTNEFLLLRWEEDKAQGFIVSLYQKYFLQSLKEQSFQSILLLYEEVLCLTKLPASKPIFACRWSNENQKKYSNIFMMTQQHMLLLNLSLSPVTELQSNKYLKMEIDNLFDPYQHEQFAEGMRVCTTGKDNYLLVYNDKEVHYAKKEADKLRHLSYFSLVNEEFMSFRNNLAIEQLSDDQFMGLFNQKTPLKQLKWVTDDFIVVLFDSYIAILEIGGNDTLVFKHDIKMKEVRVVELLQIDGPKSIYVQDAESRIFTLNDEGKLDFHSNLEDQIEIFGKVSDWASRGRHLNLTGMQNSGYPEELLLKRDGQLVVKMANQTKSMYV